MSSGYNLKKKIEHLVLQHFLGITKVLYFSRYVRSTDALENDLIQRINLISLFSALGG